MKILIPIVLLLFLIWGVSTLQTSSYLKGQQAALKAEGEELMLEAGVTEPSLEFSFLDATIAGNAGSIETRESVSQQVSELGWPGAVRVGANQLTVNGEIHLEKVAPSERIHVSGRAQEDTYYALEQGLLINRHTRNVGYLEDEFIANPSVLDHASFCQWGADYLSLEGSRSLTIQEGTLVITGDLTESMLAQYRQEAKQFGMELDFQGDIVEPRPVLWQVSRKNGVTTAEGQLPAGFDYAPFGTGAEGVRFDPFVESGVDLHSSQFQGWFQQFFGISGDRGFSLSPSGVELQGNATPFMLRDWSSFFGKLGLQPQSKMKVFPSQYHFPDYQKESQLSAQELSGYDAVLSANNIYFETGSSDVSEVELVKVQALAEYLNSHMGKAKFVMGGHADATGNMATNLQLSRQRAESVLARLGELGVDKSLFSIVPFGASKAQGQGSSAADRRVEILIK